MSSITDGAPALGAGMPPGARTPGLRSQELLANPLNRTRNEDLGDHRNRQGPARMNKRACLPIALLALAANGLQAGRPLTTDDAGTVAPGDFEFEAGATLHRDSDTYQYEFPFGITAGLLSTLEVGIGFGSAIQEREEAADTRIISGIGDLALGAKWNPLSEEDGWASHAAAITVKLPTASEHKGLGTGKTDCDLTYIASKALAETWSAHLNVGYTWTGDPRGAAKDDLLHAGIALGWCAREEVGWVGEVFTDLPAGRGDEASVQCTVGARWSLRQNLVLDAAVGTRLRGESPDLTATLGLTWTLAATKP
jgi:hypothetical protein